jgi:membrane protease YdiL (CAAX protease family)
LPTAANTPHDALPATQSLALFGVAFLLMLAFGPLLAELGLLGLAMAQIAIIGGVPLAFSLSRYRAGAWRVLGLTTPRGTSLLGAALVGSSLWMLLAVIVLPLIEPIAAQDETVRLLEEAFRLGKEPLWLRLLVLGGAPALCEELLFRGALARSLVPRLGLVGAALVSAILFGGFHHSLVRLVPTAMLGLVLAYATFASGSLWPAMMIHFINNAIALAVASGAGLPGAGDSLQAHPWASALAGVSLTATGLWLLRPPGPPGPRDAPPG